MHTIGDLFLLLSPLFFELFGCHGLILSQRDDIVLSFLRITIRRLRWDDNVDWDIHDAHLEVVCFLFLELDEATWEELMVGTNRDVTGQSCTDRPCEDATHVFTSLGAFGAFGPAAFFSPTRIASL